MHMSEVDIMLASWGEGLNKVDHLECASCEWSVFPTTGFMNYSLGEALGMADDHQVETGHNVKHIMARKYQPKPKPEFSVTELLDLNMALRFALVENRKRMDLYEANPDVSATAILYQIAQERHTKWINLNEKIDAYVEKAR